MNIVGPKQICKPNKEFAKKIQNLTGISKSVHNSPDRNGRSVPKGMAKALTTCLLERHGTAPFRKGVAQKHVIDYLEGKNNLKVSANLLSHTGTTLIYLDVDTHGKGKTEDALAVFDMIRHKLPHGKVLVTKRGCGAWVVVDFNSHRPTPAKWNSFIDKFQTWVRSIVASENLDVSSAEVLGKVMDYSTNPYLMVNRCPDLLKCPPGEQFLGTPVTASWLMEQDWTPVGGPSKAKTKLRGGSRASHRLSAAQLKGIDRVASVLDSWFPGRPKTVGNWAITSQRFAELLVVIASSRPNKDGSMPYKMHQSAIQQLHAEGQLQYGWVHDIYKVVRDFLSDENLINWEDNSYSPHARDEQTGTLLQKGKAMKWDLLTEFKELVLHTAEHGSISVINTERQKACYVHTTQAKDKDKDKDKNERQMGDFSNNGFGKQTRISSLSFSSYSLPESNRGLRPKLVHTSIRPQINEQEAWQYQRELGLCC